MMSSLYLYKRTCVWMALLTCVPVLFVLCVTHLCSAQLTQYISDPGFKPFYSPMYTLPSSFINWPSTYIPEVPAWQEWVIFEPMPQTTYTPLQPIYPIIPIGQRTPLTYDGVELGDWLWNFPRLFEDIGIFPSELERSYGRRQYTLYPSLSRYQRQIDDPRAYPYALGAMMIEEDYLGYSSGPGLRFSSMLYYGF